MKLLTIRRSPCQHAKKRAVAYLWNGLGLAFSDRVRVWRLLLAHLLARSAALWACKPTTAPVWRFCR